MSFNTNTDTVEYPVFLLDTGEDYVEVRSYPDGEYKQIGVASALEDAIQMAESEGEVLIEDAPHELSGNDDDDDRAFFICVEPRDNV